MAMNLTPVPLTRELFAPFGDVIEIDDADHYSINEGTTERYHDLAKIDVSAKDGVPLISIFRGQPRSIPIKIKMMERHPLGTQAFMPLQPHPYLVAVAALSDTVGPADVKAFIAASGQGVSYRRGVWHHPLLVLEPDHDFLVIDRGGAGDNLSEYSFSDEEGVVLLNPR